MRLQRVSAAVSAGLVMVAGVLLMLDPGAAMAREHGAGPVGDPVRVTAATATTTATGSGARTVRVPAGVLRAQDVGAEVLPSDLTLPAVSPSLPAGVFHPPVLPAADDAYPVLLPPISPGPVTSLVSDGVVVRSQTVRYGDPADHNSYQVFWPLQTTRLRGGAVLLIHGGGWIMGRKELDTPNALALARAGYVAATVDYSTDPYLRPWPAAAQDVFAATDSFRSRARVYGFDPGHLVAAGWSSGGNLAELLATVGHGTRRVAAVVAWSGISDLTALTHSPSTGGCNTFGCQITALAGTVRDLTGCLPIDCPSIWANGSPSTHTGPGDAPALLIAGAHEFIPLTQSSHLATQLHTLGIPATLLVLPTDRHGGDLRPWTLTPLMQWLHTYADTTPTS